MFTPWLCRTPNPHSSLQLNPHLDRPLSAIEGMLIGCTCVNAQRASTLNGQHTLENFYFNPDEKGAFEHENCSNPRTSHHTNFLGHSRPCTFYTSTAHLSHVCGTGRPFFCPGAEGFLFLSQAASSRFRSHVSLSRFAWPSHFRKETMHLLRCCSVVR